MPHDASSNRPKEALAAIQEAIRLDPYDADFCALEAQCHHSLENWRACLEAAERGLSMDGEHTGCTNLRAIALVKLGRRDEAGQTIDAALAKEPESAVTHANMGWTLLHQGDSKKALHHFREALRLDPQNEWARAGIVEALKARNFIYALMLKYFLFMGRLSSGAQWGVIIGVYLGNRMMGNFARENPDWAPWLLPIRVLLFSFIIMTWIAYPLFNLLLRLSPFGRLALERAQIVEANWIGAALGVVLVSLTGCLIVGFNSPWFVTLVVFGLIVMPLSGTFRCEDTRKKIMIGLTSLLFLVGLWSVTLSWRSYQGNDTWIKSLSDQSMAFLGIFSVGILVTALLANAMAGKADQR